MLSVKFAFQSLYWHFWGSGATAVPQAINSNVSPSRKPVKPFSPTHDSCVFRPCHTLAEDSVLHPPVVSGQKEHRHSGRSTLVFFFEWCRKAMWAGGVRAREQHGQNFQFSCQICFLRAAGNGEMNRPNWLESCLYSRICVYFLLTRIYWREYCFLLFPGKKKS